MLNMSGACDFAPVCGQSVINQTLAKHAAACLRQHSPVLQWFSDWVSRKRGIWTSPFTYPQKKKSHGVRSGDCCCQFNSKLSSVPPRPIHLSGMFLSELPVKWILFLLKNEALMLLFNELIIWPVLKHLQRNIPVHISFKEKQYMNLILGDGTEKHSLLVSPSPA